jgi:hypothetical protein
MAYDSFQRSLIRKLLIRGVSPSLFRLSNFNTYNTGDLFESSALRISALRDNSFQKPIIPIVLSQRIGHILIGLIDILLQFFC